MTIGSEPPSFVMSVKIGLSGYLSLLLQIVSLPDLISGSNKCTRILGMGVTLVADITVIFTEVERFEEIFRERPVKRPDSIALDQSILA